MSDVRELLSVLRTILGLVLRPLLVSASRVCSVSRFINSEDSGLIFWVYQQNVERLIVDAESLASNAKTKFRQGLQYDLPLYKTTCYIHKAATPLKGPTAGEVINTDHLEMQCSTGKPLVLSFM